LLNDATRALLVHAGALIAAFALAVVVLGEIALRLRRAGNRLYRPLGIVRATVLPSFALLVFLVHVAGLAEDDVWVRGVETAMWIFVVHAVLSLIAEVVFGNADEGSWQARTPRLLVDFARGLLIATAAAVVLSFVWGLDVKEGFAALGLGSIVIGLALQDPLGNLFSGLLVALERPFKVGDWLKVGDSVGRVTEINWRATHLQLGSSETVVMPNPVLARQTFVNLSRPSPDLRQSLELRYPTSVPPARVKRVVMEVLEEIDEVLAEPAPAVFTQHLEEAQNVYSVQFSVDEVAHGDAARDAFMTRMWYAGRREGLVAPKTSAAADESAGTARADTVRLLRSLPQIAAGAAELPDGGRSGVLLREYAPGEPIVRQGERLRGFYLVVRGTVVLTVRARDNTPREIGRINVGEFFGALQQAGETSDVTAASRSDTAVLLFQDAALEALLQTTPRIYRDVAEATRKRRAQARLLVEGAA
jgi:small-conductance mechanosensitive channel